MTDQPEKKEESPASDSPANEAPAAEPPAEESTAGIQNDAVGNSPSPKETDAPNPEGGDADSVLVVDQPDPEDIDPDALEALVTHTYLPVRSPKLKELLESPDPPSRFMTWLSIAFALLAIACVGTLLMKYWEARKAREPIAAVEPSSGPEKIVTEPLGEFRMMLKEQNELRVDIVAECTNEAACLYLRDHLVQARDIVIPVLVNARREELLNPDSKTVIRRRITEQLNSLPLEGKVIQVLFTDLTVEDAR